MRPHAGVAWPRSTEVENLPAGLLTVFLAVLAGIFVLAIVQVAYFVYLCRWADRATSGLGYYGRSREERSRFRQDLAAKSRPVMPLLKLLSRQPVRMENASFEFRGCCGPKDSCAESTFAAAANYEPTEADIFVVTQMKCGTTWMQHLVYQLLTRGAGNLVDSGNALYAISPWIEARTSVPMEAAPLIGETFPRRLIKTHLPSTLCPFSERARYIYVVRHPLSCFASTADFLRNNVGPFHIPTDTLEAWFCSERMWWRPWPEHVCAWWVRAQEQPNVLFVRFEDMKRDLASSAARVAAFLGLNDITPDEWKRILHHCSFGYMRDHSEAFEMSVPTVLNAYVKPFVSGKIDRHEGLPETTKQRILEWAERSLEGEKISFATLYPDAASPAATSIKAHGQLT